MNKNQIEWIPKVTWGEIIIDTDNPSWVMFIYKIQVRLDALMMIMMSKMRNEDDEEEEEDFSDDDGGDTDEDEEEILGLLCCP